MASTYLIRSTPSETFSKLTVSCWFKGMADGTQRNFWGLYDNSDNTRFFGLYYSSNGSLYAYWKQGGEGVQFTLGTMQKFRDPSAWYHFVMTMDTTLATASDRVKFYVNGERVTSFEDSLDTITQSKTCNMMNGTTDGRMQWGGGKISGTQYYWNGLMSHCHMCVGYAYDASSFGSTDSVTGEWKINTSPSVSYGTNGGFWLKDGSQLTDSSSNSNTLTVGGGTLTNLKDNPSNSFCNINTLYQQTTGEGVIVNNCGNTVYYASNASRSCFGSIAPSSGKYYFEAKVFGGTGTVVIGIVNMAWSGLNGATSAFHDDALNFGYNVSGQKTSGGTNTAYGSAIADNDIVGVAMDLDNSKLYFSLNGVFQGSGVPTSGASGTYAAFTLASGANYTAACRLRNGTQVGFNFGNGQYSGSNLVTTNSGDGYSGTDGASKFTYQPPTGYSAINTKGLNV